MGANGWHIWSRLAQFIFRQKALADSGAMRPRCTASQMDYSVNVESLHKNFPGAYEVPSLLLDFGSWLKSKPGRSVGDFCLESGRTSDYWIENGADLHPYFAFFILDPTGGQIGYWLHEGPATLSPPIVMLGSEGQLRVISETLEEFLERLADRKTQSNLDERDQVGNEGAALAQWLKSRAIKPPFQNRRAYPDLKRWTEEWGQKQREWIDRDPIHREIADKLRKFVKPNAKAWETANFDVLLVGTQFRMWHRSFGPKPMPQNEISGLESLFRAARETRAQRIPERGLWFSSGVRVGSHGGAVLYCNFMDRPKVFGEGQIIPISDYKSDLRAFPRSKHWMPEWLEKDLVIEAN